MSNSMGGEICMNQSLFLTNVLDRQVQLVGLVEKE
jgi:hypothetical protein